MVTWTLPPLTLLTPMVPTVHPPELSTEAIGGALTAAGVDIVAVTPHVAAQLVRYDVELAPGVDPKKVERAIDAVSLAVGQKARYAGVHGRYVGIEVNRAELDPLGLRETIEASQSLIRLGLPLGMDVRCRPLSTRLAEMPHLLVAGTTGSGKSVWLAGALVSLLLRNSPADMRMVLIDPKQVELSAFEGLPHLMGDIVTEVAHAGVELRRLVDVMEQRYTLFKEEGAKQLSEYNNLAPTGSKLPRIVVVIDELADLLMTSKAVEQLLIRLLQKGRAAGIHAILATQRPEAKVFTGLIRSNVPARVVFAVQSHHDSLIALGVTGAEKLRGQGDGLFKAPGVGEPVRFQAPMVSDVDVANVVTFWKRQVASAEPAAAVEALPAADPAEEEERRILAEWRASEHAVTEATSSISPETILAEAGISPTVIDALIATIADRLLEAVAERVSPVVLSELDNGGE